MPNIENTLYRGIFYDNDYLVDSKLFIVKMCKFNILFHHILFFKKYVLFKIVAFERSRHGDIV